MNKKDIARYIDHTNLKPTATKEDIIKLCDEAHKYGFYSVCVNPRYVEFAKQYLLDSATTVHETLVQYKKDTGYISAGAVWPSPLA